MLQKVRTVRTKKVPISAAWKSLPHIAHWICLWKRCNAKILYVLLIVSTTFLGKRIWNSLKFLELLVCVKFFFLLYNGEIRQRTQNYSSRPTFVKLFVFVSADVLCYNMIPKSQILPILLNTKNDGSAFHLHTEALNDLWCFTHFITDDDLNFYTHT